MTIQDAIKSGKPFRRTGWGNKDYWMEVRDGWFSPIGSSQHAYINPKDILATDWEVKP